MASAPVVDVAALLLPVPGDDPAGTPVPLTVRQKLEAMRKEFETHPDNPALPPVPRKPEWREIRKLAEETFTRTSKDLETGFRLTEALFKLHGFAGLRDGLHLLVELFSQCWERMHPIPDEGEGMEVRAERFYWITEPDKGARFPMSIRAIPLVRVKGEPQSYHDLLLAMQGQGEIPASAFESAEPLSADIVEDVAHCAEELSQLERVLTEKCGHDAPALTGLRQAIEECRGYVDKVAHRHAPAASMPEAAPTNGALASGQAVAPARAQINSREEAYRQLAQIANVLEQLEPHSPIPDLLRRAIELGKMPFRQLIHELVREPNLVAEIRREFGIKEGEAPAAPAT